MNWDNLIDKLYLLSGKKYIKVIFIPLIIAVLIELFDMNIKNWIWVFLVAFGYACGISMGATKIREAIEKKDLDPSVLYPEICEPEENIIPFDETVGYVAAEYWEEMYLHEKKQRERFLSILKDTYNDSETEAKRLDKLSSLIALTAFITPILYILLFG